MKEIRRDEEGLANSPDGRFSDVVPSVKLDRLIYHAPGGRKMVPLSKARDQGAQFGGAWQQLL